MTGAAMARLLSRFWPAIPIIAAVALAMLFRAQRDDARQTLRNERQAWTASLDRADRARADQERGFAQQIAAAATSFADRLAAREPIILRSTNTVREYAQTAAGRVMCRGADRVREIDSLDADLADRSTGAAQRGDGTLRANAAASTARR
ncbi:MAG: hypothetical protein PGN16_03670 [Sphingomonas phyllosphaerae]|uniref:hypothetical protein n=1 Tax=Sphingomonas phyllosphaerae TaxID=257003 RepID=UPI002FFB2D7F